LVLSPEEDSIGKYPILLGSEEDNISKYLLLLGSIFFKNPDFVGISASFAGGRSNPSKMGYEYYREPMTPPRNDWVVF